MNTCCIIVHKNIPDEKREYIIEQIKYEILLAIAGGYTHFISTMTEGAALDFARIVAELKEKNSTITLEAALPYRTWLNKHKLLLKKCDAVTVRKENWTGKSCLTLLNLEIMERVSCVIVVYNSSKKDHNTELLIRHARAKNHDLRIITV